MDELIEDIILYLGVTSESDKAQVTRLVKKAVSNVCNKRYPYGFSDTDKENAIIRYGNIISDAAIYAFSKIGAEGQSTHSENGTSRAWVDESKLYADIVPMCGSLS